MIYDYNINQYAEKEISISATGKLKIIRGINELLVDFIGKDALKLSLNSNMYKLYDAISQPQDGELMTRVLLLRDVIETLNKTESISDIVQSVYLYMEDANYIISTNYGASHTDDFIDTSWLVQYKAADNAEWLPSRIPTNAVQIPRASQEAGSPMDYVTSFLFPLNNYTTQLRGAILINLSEKKLSRMINSNSENEGQIYIIDRSGVVISHPNPQLIGQNLSNQPVISQILESDRTEGYFTEKSGKDRSLISYYKSDVNNWLYIGTHSLDFLALKAKELRTSLLYLFGMLLVLEVAVIYLILKRLYSPVRQLVQSLKDASKVNLNYSGNEFVILSRAFEEITKQEEQLFSAIEKNKQTMRDQALKGILSGKQQPELAELRLMNISLSGSRFVCVLLAIDRYERFRNAFASNHQSYLKSAILKMFCDAVQEPLESTGVILDGGRIALILSVHSIPMTQLRTDLQSIANSLQQEISQLMDITITVAHGNIHEGWTGIEASYKEAAAAARKRLLAGWNSILWYEEKNAPLPKAYYPVMKENAIFNQLQTASMEGVEKAINELIAELRKMSHLSVDHIYLILNQFIAATIKYASDASMNVSELEIKANTHIYQQLLDYETLDEINQWFIFLFGKLHEHIHANKLEKTDYMSSVMLYINQNYRSDIDLAELADKMGVSYSQLRRRFQSETGENMLVYINKLRIAEAKELLCQKSIPIIQIALKLGYNNEQSFNRFFKKFEGITPGEYRRVK
jgi:AraC-like DNA-binding protein